MIDLHTHTIYSDGTWSVKELLMNAENAKVTTLSITDHNSVKAYIELEEKDYSKIFSGKIISGCEFSCVFNGVKIELLGYNFDIDEMKIWLQRKYSNNQENNLLREFELLIENCERNGIMVDNVKYNPKMGWPVDYVYNLIKKYPQNRAKFSNAEWNDIDYFFRCCTCDKNFPLYIDFSLMIPSAKLVSDCIRKLNGKVFIAHLYKYPLNDYEKYLDELVSNNIIDGIEVYYSKFSNEQIKFLEDYCKKNNLYMSVGTDCHGDKKPDRKIGIGYGNMNYSDNIISDWL